jgi:hypothetical protein
VGFIPPPGKELRELQLVWQNRSIVFLALIGGSDDQLRRCEVVDAYDPSVEDFYDSYDDCNNNNSDD